MYIVAIVTNINREIRNNANKTRSGRLFIVSPSTYYLSFRSGLGLYRFLKK